MLLGQDGPQEHSKERAAEDAREHDAANRQ
jgi:hypothetical protein